MSLGTTVFSQITDFLPWKTVDRIVARRGGATGVRTLTCAEQYRAMAFAQLAFRDSLRDMEACPVPQTAKLHHMGACEPVARSTLADVNELCNGRTWTDLAGQLITQIRALDFTITDLCLTPFP